MAIDRRPIDQMILDVGPEAFRRLARLFQDETRGAAAEMRGLFAAQDWRELGRHAHSMKHATASFGLVDLAAAAAGLEQAADGGDAGAAAGSLAQLTDRIDAEVTAFAALIDEIAVPE